MHGVERLRLSALILIFRRCFEYIEQVKLGQAAFIMFGPKQRVEIAQRSFRLDRATSPTPDVRRGCSCLPVNDPPSRRVPIPEQYFRSRDTADVRFPIDLYTTEDLIEY
jgi:hypothetical protein